MAKSYSDNEEVNGNLPSNMHNASCDSCRSAHIYSDRYKCLECNNYDLCGQCFEERRQTRQHSSGHAMVHFKIPNELFGQYITHSKDLTLAILNELLAGKQHNIKCDGCLVSIVGVRFKCDSCHNYNLCSKCMQQRVISKTHQNTHPLVVASNQSLVKIDTSDILKTKVLGQGAFGQVYKAIWLSKNREVACKVIKVTAHRRHLEESFRKELNAYAELSGAYILKTFGYGERMIANGVKECYLITELMHRGSLSDVVHNGTERVSLRRKLAMACHVASGMRKLHAHTMIHRDIRSDNILVSNNYVAKIGDMGIAHVFNPNERHTLVGCLPFMPPEFHRGDGQYDQSLDVFTFGLTLNEMFTEKPHRFNQATRRIRLTENSPIFLELVTRCILDESSQRPTAVELEDVLNKCRRATDKYIKEKHSDYSNETLVTKDAIFVKVCEACQKLQKAEPKPVYLPPPRPRFNSDLIRQYFDDMMKQFLKLRHFINFRRSKHQEPAPQGDKIMKYMDDSHSDDQEEIIKPQPIKIDVRAARCPSPPADFLRGREENHQQFLNLAKNSRSKTPSPFSPRFDNRELQQPFYDRVQPRRPLHADNGVRQRVVQFQ